MKSISRRFQEFPGVLATLLNYVDHFIRGRGGGGGINFYAIMKREARALYFLF